MSVNLSSASVVLTIQEGVQRGRQPLRGGRPAAARGRDAQVREQVPVTLVTACFCRMSMHAPASLHAEQLVCVPHCPTEL